MSKNTLPGESRGDDIDLLDLLSRIRNAFASMFNGIGRGFLVSVAFLFRNVWPLLFSVIIGLVLSLTLKMVSKPFYVSEIILRSNAIPNSDMIEYFGKLTAALKENNYAGISSALSVPLEKASKIDDIRPYWVVDKNKDNVQDYIDYKGSFNVYDTLDQRMQDRFVVEVSLGDPSILPAISKGFLSFPRNNEAFRLKNDFRLKKNTELLTRLAYDIKQLDSLQKVKYFEETRNKIPEKGGQMIFLQEQKTQLVYDDIYNLYQRKQSLEQENELYSDLITVMSDFSIPVKRHNGGFYFGEIAVPACFVITLIILILMSNRKRLKEFYRKY
jgi:hypothetical protein